MASQLQSMLRVNEIRLWEQLGVPQSGGAREFPTIFWGESLLYRPLQSSTCPSDACFSPAVYENLCNEISHAGSLNLRGTNTSVLL